MAHNKFNMNVNEAQITIQQWMEEIKRRGIFPPPVRSEAALLEHLMLRGGFSSVYFALKSESMVQQLKHISGLFAQMILQFYLYSQTWRVQASNFSNSTLLPLGKRSFFSANGIIPALTVQQIFLVR